MHFRQKNEKSCKKVIFSVNERHSLCSNTIIDSIKLLVKKIIFLREQNINMTNESFGIDKRLRLALRQNIKK